MWQQETVARKKTLPVLLVLAIALISGCIDSPGDGVQVITVGATDYEDHVASFSGSGPTRDGRTKPTVVAPGVDVISTVPPGMGEDPVSVYYARDSGTSLATPVAAGVAALLLQADPSLTPAGAKAAMTRGAQKLNNTLGEEYEEYYQGAGRIDAYRSYSMLEDDLCGVIPDKWIAGRWVYMGLYTGADRLHKKMYALAPGEEDWTTKFLFFTDKELDDVSTSITGSVSEWISLQPPPRKIPANGQRVFGASLAVPEGTPAGQYEGSIDIMEDGMTIFSIPVLVEVARPIEIIRGSGIKADVLKNDDWHYYYVDIPPGAGELEGRLSWREESDLDLFMLAPTSEYWTGEQSGNREKASVIGPPSGSWIIAVHAWNLTDPVRYTLEVERSLLESDPLAWSAGSVSPGTTLKTQFLVDNKGTALENLSYKGVKEESCTDMLAGSVEGGKTWNVTVDVEKDASRLHATLNWEDEESDLDLRLYNPEGKLIDSSTNEYENQENVESLDPVPGAWRLEVYGYSVPKERNQSFDIEVNIHSQEEWPWVSAKGPEELEGGDSGILEAELTVPANASGCDLDGYIWISSVNESFDIPISLTVVGASLLEINDTYVSDFDGDGFFNQLCFDAGVNVSIPDDYRLEGSLVDSSGEMIEWFESTKYLQESTTISLCINGTKIWRLAKSGPLKIENLFLYHEGELLDFDEDEIIIEHSPDEFQPPQAYFTGHFSDETRADGAELENIVIMVEVTILRPDTYKISARLENDEGVEIGEDEAFEILEPGCKMIMLEFSPTKFMMIQESSRFHLRDLTLSVGETELEKLDDAYTTEEYSSDEFTSKKKMIVIS